MHATPMEALEGEAAALLYSPFSAQLAPSSSSSSQCQQHLLQQQDQPTTSFPCPGLVSGIDLASLLLPSTMGLLQPMPASEGEGAGGAGGGKDKGRNSGKSTKKVSRPRFAFKTRTPSDILDDGYRWRKYGQKAVKNSAYPRSYYRCTHHTCNVKKQVQRLSKDTSIVVTTYEGIHNHPCEKLMEALSPLLKQMQFLNGF